MEIHTRTILPMHCLLGDFEVNGILLHTPSVFWDTRISYIAYQAADARGE